MAETGAMMMKALSIAAIFALGVVGTACSQTSEAAEDEAKAETETEDVTEAAADTGGSFNLGLPTEAAAAPAAGGSFNLGLPSEAAASTDGFNLGTEVAASNGLANLPDVATPVIDTDVVEANEDDEPVIRLEDE
ncbi:MAG: hypothetical protein AAGJ68_15605 [Pseudomonadota bacterium]